MLQPTTISAPVTAPASPATPRAQRTSRKSGLTAALLNQNQAQSQQGQNGQQNVNKNNNGRQPRNPANTHARHQSMPPQQRGGAPNSPASNNSKANNNNSNVTILKRSSASVVTPNSSIPIAGAQSTPQQGKQSNSNNNNGQQSKNQKSRSQQNQHQNQNNNNNGPSKQKRTPRRRDNDSPAVMADQESTMNRSPLMNPSSPPSSTDSDDSESTASLSRSYKNVKNKQQQQALPTKGYGQLSCSPPQRPSSAPAVPQPRKGMNAHHRSADYGLINMYQNQSGLGNRKPSFGSASTLPLGVTDAQFRPNVAKAVSADKIMLADRVCAEKNKLYAGPTFHNSPAPTSLPIPAFSRSLGGSPAEHAVEMLPTTPFFAEAASPQLNSARLRTQSETTGWTGHHSMPGMPLQRSNLGLNYQLPDRMATSSYTFDESTTMMQGSDQLMEISQNLRSLLKIQSQ
ncbi:hypothetical protein BGZ83_007310 [Gryganskiella cystojenkinii]|nr:hypothetical protein BGZ83_007310 [Gryganskiella cystojenkinii]